MEMVRKNHKKKKTEVLYSPFAAMSLMTCALMNQTYDGIENDAVHGKFKKFGYFMQVARRHYGRFYAALVTPKEARSFNVKRGDVLASVPEEAEADEEGDDGGGRLVEAKKEIETTDMKNMEVVS
mmetsp:Transcript_2235/g.5299  ORF Transcript_2235/g.5299 Transcript_2235/m.5299 type:complete len:125 (+) Transcript_2235:5133-5507(+)